MRIEEESPLRFLDLDVSKFIYETYFPNKKIIQQKSMVIDQFKYHLKEYLNTYKLPDIYGPLNIISTTRRPRGTQHLHGNAKKHYSFNSYLINVCKFKITLKRKYYSDIRHKPSYKRANRMVLEGRKKRRELKY